MTLRLIVRTDDAAMAANVGGSVHTEYDTFEIEAPEVERFLRTGKGSPEWTYAHRQIVGVELIPPLGAETIPSGESA
jgi:hypothetical protein